MIRIGQVGLGAWGKNLLRNFYYLPGCELGIGCDQDAQRLERFRREYPSVRFTTDFGEILSDQKLQAVVVATPPESHYSLAKASLKAGKDVFVEKPLVLRLEEGEELVELANRKRRVLMVGHIMEYHPATLKLKDLIKGGVLGRVYYLYSTRVNLGKVREIENALWSFAPHDVSIILYLLEEEPVRVTANGMAYLREGIEDVAFATLYFEGGMLAHIHVSWLDPHKIRKVTVVGQKKMAVFDDMESAEKIRIYDKGVDYSRDYESYGEYLSLRHGDILIPRLNLVEPLRSECEHFLSCVEERATPRSDGKDGLRVLKVLGAAQKSLENGGTPVEIQRSFASNRRGVKPVGKILNPNIETCS